MEALERAKTNGQGPRRPQANARATSRRPVRASTAQPPGLPQSLGEEARKDQPQRIICATTKPRFGPQSTAGATANEAAIGRRDRGRLAPKSSKSDILELALEMAVLCWSLSENNTLELKSNILELALLEFI